MRSNAVERANALSDHELLARLDALAGQERESAAELVAHLAALDARPSLYAALGYGSLFGYCTHALRLSEDAACTRIEAARACRSFPMILEDLAAGTLTLTAVRLLRRHLTGENHLAVLERARGRSSREIEVLIAHLAPRPDAVSLIRRLPSPGAESTMTVPSALLPSPVAGAVSPPMIRSTPPPVIRPTAPRRYRVQFTIGEETHDMLRRLQALLCREIPGGDPAVIFDRAVALLLADVERRKLGAVQRPRIRRATDGKPEPAAAAPPIAEAGDALGIRTPPPAPRSVPRAVRRTVSGRDGGQCAYVSGSGRRCTERRFLEFHHVRPYARGGPATVGNIELRCRRHNRYEAELEFGPPAPG